MIKKTFLLTILFSALVFPASTQAQTGIPFGGQIISPPLPCTCPPFGFLMVIKPALPAWPTHLMYFPGISILYPYYQMHPGAHVLGLVDVPIQCLMLTPWGCWPVNPNGPGGFRIQMMGTSI